MEKEKSRGRTRKKQPSRMTSFLVHEGRRWCAAILSLCLILNNMTSIAWAAEAANEEEVLFKLTSSSLYEALQEAVQKGNTVDENFLFAGKEKDVEAYEKLLLMDDDLYELKPEFEDKKKDENEEKNKDVKLRIFASLSWEVDPEREYQVVGDEKIIFLLSNASETEQTAVIQVDEQKTDSIIVVPKSAVIIEGEGETLESETKDAADKETEEAGESEGQVGEENLEEEAGEKPGNSGGSGSSGTASGGTSGTGNETEEDSKAPALDDETEAEKDETAGKNETEKETDGVKTEVKETEGEENKTDDVKTEETEKTDEGKNDTDKEETERDEADKAESDTTSGSTDSKKDEPEKEESGKNEGNRTEEEDKGQSKPEASDRNDREEAKDDKTESAGNSGNSDNSSNSSSANDSSSFNKTESGNSSAEKTESDKSSNSGNSSSSDKSSNTGNSSSSDKSNNTSNSSNSDKSDSSDRSNSSDSSSRSDNSSSSSDKSSDKGTEVSAVISRNRIRLVADNLDEADNFAEDGLEEEEVEAEEETAGAAEETMASEVEKAETIEEAKTEETSAEETKAEETKADTASASDAEDKEIEGELFEAVVMDEKSVVVFVTTAEELGLNNAALRKASDSNAERVTPAFEKEVELENVIVQVKADENVLPEGAQLQVKELKAEGEDAAQYEEAKEALDSKGTEYDGMMALDISFLDKKGREIEPDGNVQVSIKVKKEALPEEADLESITVQHLAEDEGEIFVEEVADSGNKTRGKVEVEAEEHVEAAFEVDSFSVFTVTWAQITEEEGKFRKTDEMVIKFNINFYELLKETNEKKVIDEQRITIANKMEIFETWDMELPNFFEETVQGYDYEKAEFSATCYDYVEYSIGYAPKRQYDESGKEYLEKIEYQEQPVNSIQVTKMENSFAGFFPYLVTIKNSQGAILCPCGTGEIDRDPNSGEEWIRSLEIDLDLYYTKSDVGILNTIAINGLISADRELTEGQRYIWYRWSKDEGKECPSITEEGDNQKKIRNPDCIVKRQLTTGNQYNIDASGMALNVALDEGANCYYLVAIEDKDGIERMASRPFLVEYANSLVNGSFEEPKLTNLPNDHAWYQYPNDYEGLVWKSTTGDVEIAKLNSVEHNLYEDLGEDGVLAGQGKQCAELNPESAGALYQDVLTIPGSTLHWSLLHRARGGKQNYQNARDKMHVVIMPTAEAERLLQERLGDSEAKKPAEINAELDKLIKDIVAHPTHYSDSARVWQDIESPQTGWTRHSDEYIVGENQYLTRFFFVAGDTGSYSITEGNLLDEVYFGLSIPPVEAERGKLSITKEIRGLSRDDIDKDDGYKLKLKITAPQGVVWKDFGLNPEDNHWKEEGEGEEKIVYREIEMSTFTSKDGIHRESRSISNLPEGEYIIEEVVMTEEYKTPEVSMLQVQNQETNNGNSILDTQSEKYVGKIQIKEGQISYVKIINAYQEEKGKFTVKKVFENGQSKITDTKNPFADVSFALYKTDEKWGAYSEADLEVTGKVQLDSNSESGGMNISGIIEFSSIPEGYYYLHEETPPEGYQQADDRQIFVGTKGGKFGVYLYNAKTNSYEAMNANVIEVVNKEVEIPSGTILPDTGGPGLAMFERYGWFLLMLALLMAGVEVRCYGERKYKRASATQHEEFDEPL